MGLVYVALGVFLLLAAALFCTEICVYFARRSGRYPGKGQATINDVQKLVLKGDRIFAIRAYREVTGTSLKKAKAFVKEMEKSLRM